MIYDLASGITHWPMNYAYDADNIY